MPQQGMILKTMLWLSLLFALLYKLMPTSPPMRDLAGLFCYGCYRASGIVRKAYYCLSDDDGVKCQMESGWTFSHCCMYSTKENYCQLNCVNEWGSMSCGWKFFILILYNSNINSMQRDVPWCGKLAPS